MSTPANQTRRFGGRMYALDRFDKHLCLKPPFGLVLCMLVLCRDLLFAVASAGSSLKGQGVNLSMLSAHEHRAFFIAGLVPALFVLWSFVRRVPDGGAVARWVWRHGAQCLTASALIQSIPALQAAWQGQGFRAEFYQSPWVLLVTAWLILYLFNSIRARDAFSDFPQG
jgi:Protein of unknown function (DUF2919)